MIPSSIPTIFPGGISVDDRGQLSFVNGFDFAGVKRFYTVENFSTETIRAFHGHEQEEKYIYAVRGSAIVCAVHIPFTGMKPYRWVLTSREPKIIHIPQGYANGFRALEPGTILMFFSTATLEESAQDDERYPWDHWGKEIWEVAHR